MGLEGNLNFVLLIQYYLQTALEVKFLDLQGTGRQQGDERNVNVVNDHSGTGFARILNYYRTGAQFVRALLVLYPLKVCVQKPLVPLGQRMIGIQYGSINSVDKTVERNHWSSFDLPSSRSIFL